MSKSIQRSYYQYFTTRLKEPKKFIQVIFGPRQVGKTTLVSQVCEELDSPFLSISADDIANSNSEWIDAQWSVARTQQAQHPEKDFVIFIDEIQKIGNWSEVVKKNWDLDTKNNLPIKVVLLGSSRLLLQQGLTESLAGRFETTYMGHWSLTEMQKTFGWTPEQYVWFGGYPGSASLIEDEERWKKYITDALIETSISKDILMLTRVDKPALMRRLFELGCTYSGQILSYTKLLGQLHDAGNTTTLANYLRLLDTAGLLAGIENFTTDKVTQRASSPKFQVYNNALLSVQRNESFSEALAKPELWGRMVESSVGGYLINQSFAVGYKVYYWRHRSDEVDFVLERRGKVIGIEVKSGHRQKLAGLKAFNEIFHPDKTLLVGKDGMPWQEFLLMPLAQLF